MEFLTVPEVAQELRVSKSMVSLLCQQGKLPVVRLGTAVRIPAHELELWLQ